MDAVRMSAALSRALLEIPHSYADGYTEEERLRAAPLGESRAHPSVEQSDPLIYFSRPGRDTLERFIRIASGPLRFARRAASAASFTLTYEELCSRVSKHLRPVASAEYLWRPREKNPPHKY
jgi:hypothetical protein